MSGITSAMNAALSGLEQFEMGIEAVSNNLTNASTPGYSVESINPQEVTEGVGQPGGGVLPAVVTRASNNFAAAQLYQATSQNAAASNASSELTALSDALTNNGDVQTTIEQFFNDISTLAADPTSSGQAQTVLSDAASVVSSFQNAAGSIQASITNSADTVTQSVQTANGLLTQLATINKALIQAPNDPSLLDQQQEVLTSLSSEIGFNTVQASDGTISVYSGGTVLVDQAGAQTISASTNSEGEPVLTVGSDNTPLNPTEQDGSIGSAVSTWQAGNSALQSLNAVATVFAGLVNTAQAQGLTSTGAQGGDLFTTPAATTTPNLNNTGGATVTVASVNASQLPTNGGPFQITYTGSGSGWTAVNQATGQSVAVNGNPPSFAGVTLSVSSSPTPAVGDSWMVNPVSGAAEGLSVSATNPDQIAAADPYVGTPGTLQADGSVQNNNGGIIDTGSDSVVSSPATGAAVIPSSYYGQSLIVTFTSPTAYSVATSSNPGTSIATGTFNSSTGGNIAVAYPAGAASGSYWQLPITGTPDTGDTLTLEPGSSSSGSNATRMAALWTASNTNQGGTLQQAIVGVSTQLGANALEATSLSTETGDRVTAATDNLQTVSGVDSDQQAVMLTNYQQAYQASAQAISTAHNMFESLITAVQA